MERIIDEAVMWILSNCEPSSERLAIINKLNTIAQNKTVIEVRDNKTGKSIDGCSIDSDGNVIQVIHYPSSIHVNRIYDCTVKVLHSYTISND